MTSQNQGAAQLTAVVVTYQSEGTIGRTLEALRRCRDAGLLDCVVVDNDSRDGTAALLDAERGWSDIVLTGTNHGFGRGCNIGFARVSTPYTVFINPDAVVEPDAIRTLLRFIETRPNVGIVGPAILEGEPGAAAGLQAAGARPTPGHLLRAALPLLRPSPLERPIEPGSTAWRAGWVCGAVFLVRTDLMRRLGGFDPRFFLYWEETDVCKRAEEAGFETWAVGEAVTRHVGGASSSADDTRVGGCIARHYYQSRFYYLAKHHGWLAAATVDAVEAMMNALRALFDSMRGRGWSRLRPRLQARLFSQPEQV